ncbi:disintegrin [Botrytis cinerea]
MHILRSVVVLTALFSNSINAHSNERNPLTYISKVETPIIKTPSHRVHALSSFDVEFGLHGGQQRVKLSLKPNHDVIAEGATITHLAADGTVRTSETIDRSAHRVFKGSTWLQPYDGADWTNVGWARIIVKKDGDEPLFEGAFKLDGDHHHIQTKTSFKSTRHALDPSPPDEEKEYMVVWRDSDIGTGYTEDNEGLMHPDLRRSAREGPSCSADGLNFNTMNNPINNYEPMAKREEGFWGSISTRAIFGRQLDTQSGGNSAGVNLATTIGSTAGCPSTRKVALVGIATDCTYTAAFNSTETARENVIQILNSASVQYEDSFNITLGLQNLTVSDAACPATASSSAPWNVGCSDSVTIQDRLNLFSAWRGERQDTNAYWTLLSTCGTGSAVGLAWLGQACVTGAQVASTSSGNETVSGANVVVRTSTEWQVLAHETGHTFGAVHDCTSSTCNDGQTVAAQQCCPLSSTTCDAGGAYIMNPALQVASHNSHLVVLETFVPLSEEMEDITIITASQCGNGIVESGEDCDCGGTSGCGSNSCCDPTTCKFRTNAVCDPSNEDCCTSTCQFASSGTVCRASTGVCDPQEVCSGTAATCPVDATAPDGTSCGNSSSLSCASGQCTSRDLQCKTIMGSYTTGNDTYACSSSGCQISCASPEFGSHVCYSMQQNFLDGTSCQGGGKCSNGDCKGASVSKEITSWIQEHRNLVIGIASAVGALLIFAILSCCIGRMRRRRAIRLAKERAVNNPHGWSQGPNMWQAPLSGARGGRGAAAPSGGTWVDGRWIQPPPPGWQPSARYA